MVYRLKTKRALWVPTGNNFQNHRRIPLPAGSVVVLLRTDFSGPSGIALDWVITSTSEYGYILITASAEGWDNTEEL